ncbi:MAG: alpha/beta hydrolase [bacterium]
MTEKKTVIKNIKINYKIFGEHGKPIFLILHGWNGSSDSWIKVCEILKKEYEIYCLDFPFFGKSEALKEAWVIDDYVEMVEEFAKKIILNDMHKISGMNIIAHSFGGRVAIKLAAKNYNWIESIFLCDAAGIKHQATIKQKIAKIFANAGKKILQAMPAETNKNFAPAIRKIFYKLINGQDYYNCKDEIMKKTFQNIINEDLCSYLEKIKIHTEIIWGEKDKYTPLADGRSMNEKIKNSNLHIIKNTGHGVHLRAEKQLTEIIKRVRSELTLTR